MITLINPGIRVALLLILQTLCLGTSHAQPASAPQFTDEAAKQEGIYQSKDDKTPEGYVVDRGLLFYTFTLPAEFDRSLETLGPADRWLDIGAGKGQAVLDYHAPGYDAMHAEGRERHGKKAQAVAMSIEDRRTPDWAQTAASLDANKIQYLFGKRLREYTLEQLGQFQVITDMLGGFSYSENLSLFMQKVLSFLTLNGSFYTVLQDVHSESGTNRPYYPNARYLTEIVNVDASEMKVCSWLKRIGCVQVTCELKPGWKPPVEVYRIHKVCNDVTVPELKLVHFEAGTPPERRFQLGNPLVTPASPDQNRATR